MKEKKNKKRFGVKAIESYKKSGGKISASEVHDNGHAGYIKDIEWCIEHALDNADCTGMKFHDDCKKFPTGDFFVEVNITSDPLLSHVIKTTMLARQSCPTPKFDQIVYHYHSTAGDLEYLWNVPDKKLSLAMLEELKNTPEDEKHLVQNILDFFSEELLARSKRLNGEEMKPGIILKHARREGN